MKNKYENNKKILEDDFLNYLSENDELLFKDAENNSTEIEDNVWVPNKEWFK